MKVSSNKIVDILDRISTKWRTGPAGISSTIGYSRQTIHTWNKLGATEIQYKKLEKFLQDGPSNRTNNKFIIRVSLVIDIINPTDKAKSDVEKAILALEQIKKRWI